MNLSKIFSFFIALTLYSCMDSKPAINGSWQGLMVNSLYTEIHIFENNECYLFWGQAMNFPQLQIKYLDGDTVELIAPFADDSSLIKLKILQHDSEKGVLKWQNTASKEEFTLKKLPIVFDPDVIFSPNKEFYDAYTEEFMLRNWDFPRPEIYKK